MLSMRSSVVFLAAFVLLFAAHPQQLRAASLEGSDSIKPSLDKIAASADRATAARLNRLYGEFLTLREQNASANEQIRSLHYSNEETHLLLRSRIKQIDADRIGRLETLASQARDRYKPLFASYANLNRQIDIARTVRQKTLVSILTAQAGAMRLAVQLAREEIRAKEAQLASAKDGAAKSARTIRSTLDGIAPVDVKVKAEKSGIAASEKALASVWKTFTRAVSKKNAAGAADALGGTVAVYRQIVDRQQRIIAFEKTISGTLDKAKTQFPRQ